MDLDSLLIPTELSQSDNEQLDIRDCYETSDDYETMDDEYSSNKLVVSEEHALKKKRNCGMNSKTILEKQAELANHLDVLEVLGPLCVRCKHCKKLIKLKRNYDNSRIESHVSNSKCTKNKGFQDLKNFFSVSNPQDKLSYNKRYPCSGLCEEKHLKYIERVGGFITFGGAPPVYKVAQELFPLKFTNETKFSYSKLSSDQSRRLNDELSARSKWRIDQECLCIRSSVCEIYTDQIGRICVKCILLTKDQVFKNAISKPIPKPENRYYTPKLYFKSNLLLKFLRNLDIKDLWTSISYNNETNAIPFWVKLAEKGLNGAFESKATFKGLCELMLQIAQREEHNKGVQNLKYSEDFTHFTAILSSISPRAYDFYRVNLAGQTLRNIRLLCQRSEEHMSDTSICLENMAWFKRLADSMNYNGPVIAMTDNTKLYPRLGYSANLGCIIGSTFSYDQTRVEYYDEVETIIRNIISNNAIAKQVRLYLLQIPLPKFPPIVIGLVPNNGSETSTYILQMHETVLEIASQLSIHIISIGADGASTEFNAQKYLMTKNTRSIKGFSDPIYNINFTCPVFSGVGPVIRVSDPLHARKSARNALFSGARFLTLGHYVATYDQVLDMCEQDDSVLYKKDVINCDRQDDGASYRLFCSSLLSQVMNSNSSENIRYRLFVYLFVIGELIDAYQNRMILHLERARMAMIAYFFLMLWRSYILSARSANSNYISLEKNFLATQTFNILTSLAESLILLIVSHRDFYDSYPLLPWLHGSEGCEHFFGLCRQINNDFTFSDLLYMVPKVSYIYKAYTNGTLNEVIKDKTSGVGYIAHYNTGTLAETINILRQWPSDDDLLCAVHEGYQQAWDLAKVLSMVNCNNELFNSLNTFKGKSNQSDYENNENDFFDDFNSLSQNNEISDSHAIATAASTIANFNTIDIRDDDIENDLRDARLELAFLLSDASSLNDLDLEIHEKFYIGITEAGALDILYLVNLRKNHKCYSNQNMERKTTYRIQNLDRMNSVSPNMISSLIADCTSNIDTSRTEKLCGIR